MSVGTVDFIPPCLDFIPSFPPPTWFLQTTSLTYDPTKPKPAFKKSADYESKNNVESSLGPSMMHIDSSSPAAELPLSTSNMPSIEQIEDEGADGIGGADFSQQMEDVIVGAIRIINGVIN